LKCQTLEEESIQLSVKGHPAKGLPFQRNTHYLVKESIQEDMKLPQQ